LVGTVVTPDTMGCQREIDTKIVAKQGGRSTTVSTCSQLRSLNLLALRLIAVRSVMASVGLPAWKETSQEEEVRHLSERLLPHGLAVARNAEGKLCLFVVIDRAAMFAVLELVEKADMRVAAAFLESLVEPVPHRIHTVLTDSGIQFVGLPKNRQGPTAAIVSRGSVSFVE